MIRSLPVQRVPSDKITSDRTVTRSLPVERVPSDKITSVELISRDKVTSGPGRGRRPYNK